MRVCPFCGSDEGWIKESSYKRPIKYRVECNVCGGIGPESYSREMAENKWDGLLSKIEDDKKFKAILNEARAPKILEKNPNLLFDLVWDVYEKKIVGNIYEDEVKLLELIVDKLKNKRTLHKYELYDIVGPIMWEGDGGNLSEESVEKFVEYLYKELTGKFTIYEEAMGGVSSPGVTLNNTPGVGNATPAPSAGMNTDGPSGSGDKWGGDEDDLYDQDGKLKKKKKKKVDEYFGEDERSRRDREYYDRLRKDDDEKRREEEYRDRELEQYRRRQEEEEVNEMNLNPYDKIGMMMAKKLGVEPPFKQGDSKTNTIKQRHYDELDEEQPFTIQSVDDYVANPDKVLNNAKKRKINENDLSFKIETLDSYQKASKHVPDHPLTSIKKKKQKVNEEELRDENALKDVKAKEELESLGIAFEFKAAKSGKDRVFITEPMKSVLDKLKTANWEEIGKNPENTIRKYKNEDKILTIYADGQTYPRATVTSEIEKDEENTSESLMINKLIPNSLDPYLD